MRLHQTLLASFQQCRSILADLRVESLARQTGFLRRCPRKIPILDFLLGLLALSSEPLLSLERLAAFIGLAAKTSYSKQALAKRLRLQVQEFLAQVLIALFAQWAGPLAAQGCWSPFQRVLLQDSTVLALPDRLAQAFPGSGNQHRKKKGAALKIQWIADLLQGSLISFSLSGFRRNDQAASPDILALLRPGDLVLRDLGYFCLEVLARIEALGAFFISRFRHGLTLTDPKTGQPLNLARELRQRGRFDGLVRVGQQQLSLRLVAWPVPQETANQRRHRAQTNRDQRWQAGADHLYLLGWNIFLTNVSGHLWSPLVIAQVYRLRWRIEMIFKSWKSYLGLRQLNGRSPNLLRLSVMTTLLWCALTCHFCEVLETLCTPAGRHVSLLRLARVLARHSLCFAAVVLGLRVQTLLEFSLNRHIFYEQRLDRSHFYQLRTAALG
jgi:DDE family transposase